MKISTGCQFLLSFAFVLGAYQGANAAGQATAVMPVSANVPQTCTVAATPVNFGTITTLVANIDNTGSVSWVCNGVNQISLSLGGGANLSGGSRQLASGANRIAYSLYSDAAHTTLWGDNSALGNVVIINNPPNNGQEVVYGRVPATGNASPISGAYTDNVTVTLNFN